MQMAVAIAKTLEADATRRECDCLFIVPCTVRGRNLARLEECVAVFQQGVNFRPCYERLALIGGQRIKDTFEGNVTLDIPKPNP